MPEDGSLITTVRGNLILNNGIATGKALLVFFVDFG